MTIIVRVAATLLYVLIARHVRPLAVSPKPTNNQAHRPSPPSAHLDSVFSRVFLARQLGLTDPTSPRYIPRPPRVSWQAWRRHISTWPGKGDRPTYIRPPPLSDVSSEVASEVELLRNWQEGHDRSGSGLEWLMWLMKSLFFGPLLALGVVLLAGLEQTPVTGRWRVILISPAEEEVIHRALVDKGSVGFSWALRRTECTGANTCPPSGFQLV